MVLRQGTEKVRFSVLCLFNYPKLLGVSLIMMGFIRAQ